MLNITTKTELELLRRVLDEGDEPSWSIFRGQYDPVIRCCIRKVLRRYHAQYVLEDLEDLASDIWVQLLRDNQRKLRMFDTKRGYRLSTWLGMIATNYTIDNLRRRRELSSLDEVGNVDRFMRSVDSPQASVERRQDAALAEKALSRLNDEERAFLIACYRDERPPAELARELGVTLNTIYSRKFKVRNKLGRIVDRLAKPPIRRPVRFVTA